MHGNTVRYSTKAIASLNAIAQRGRLGSRFEADRQVVRFEQKAGSHRSNQGRRQGAALQVFNGNRN
jgi:hypothetical protein